MKKSSISKKSFLFGILSILFLIFLKIILNNISGCPPCLSGEICAPCIPEPEILAMIAFPLGLLTFFTSLIAIILGIISVKNKINSLGVAGIVLGLFSLSLLS